MQSTQNQVTDPVMTPFSDVNVSRTLRDAASYLDRYGWVQGVYYDPAASVFTPAACLVGAIAMVCYGGPVDAPAHQYGEPGYSEFATTLAFFESHLTIETHSAVVDAYVFNDADERSAPEVTAALRKAADTWDQLHGKTINDRI